jgi:hypothetical protein
VPGRPFIGSEGERGSQTGKGIRRPVVGHHYWPSDSVGRGNGGSEWGVKRGECGVVSRRGGDAGAAAFGQLHPGEEGSHAGPTQ